MDIIFSDNPNQLTVKPEEVEFTTEELIEDLKRKDVPQCKKCKVGDEDCEEHMPKGDLPMTLEDKTQERLAEMGARQKATTALQQQAILNAKRMGF